ASLLARLTISSETTPKNTLRTNVAPRVVASAVPMSAPLRLHTAIAAAKPQTTEPPGANTINAPTFVAQLTTLATAEAPTNSSPIALTRKKISSEPVPGPASPSQNPITIPPTAITPTRPAPWKRSRSTTPTVLLRHKWI